MRKWLPMLILCSAQFVMVLDSSVMNVAISQIVEDLDTSIQGVQTAITLYTLVMAAFMLLGAKLGDIMGTNRAFAIGLADVVFDGDGNPGNGPASPLCSISAARLQRPLTIDLEERVECLVQLLCCGD